MGLAVGDRLGRFEILGFLGAGGMGEVFRARDLQLQREVAIKMLPAAFSTDADRRRRFEQEARAAGSLTHPNILAVHEVGVHLGTPFIVTELLDGETLRERMNGRPLPPRKAVEFSIQIARGLAAGHERGIVHRDIKPENLFVTKDGLVKILDFGLAKLIDADSAGNTETVTVDGVERAPIIGTVAYMSPEQGRGRRVDHRSDLFSFGSVLYEMLAGFPPFRRAGTADTLAAVLNDEPPDLPASALASPSLERLIRHCLEKKPEERFQSARDLVFDLESRQTDGGTGAVPAPWRLPKRAVRVATWLFSLLAAGAAGLFLGRRFLPATEFTAAPVVARMTDLVGLEESPAVSPNAQYVAFTATEKGRRQIFVRDRGFGQPHRVTTDDRADHEFPRWTSDSNSLIYFSPAAPGEVQGWIWMVPHLGGNPRQIMASIGGCDANRQGRLACFRLQKSQLELVTMSLSDPTDVQVVTALEKGYYRYPRWSPDDQRIAYQAGDGLGFAIFTVNAAAGSKPLQLTDAGATINGLTWLPDASGIVFSSSRGSSVPYLPPLSLWVVHNDRTVRQLATEYEQPDVHATGVMYAARARMNFNIFRFPFGPAAVNLGGASQVTFQTGQVLTPTVASDGRIAYLSDSRGHANLWVTSIGGGPPAEQVTFETDPAVTVGVPIWSPDGQHIAYVSSKKNNVGSAFGVWLVNPDSRTPRQLTSEGLGVAWAPDSSRLYYVDKRINGVLKTIPLTGGVPTLVPFSDPIRNVIGITSTTLYFVVEGAVADGRPEFEIRSVAVTGGPSRSVQRISASRVASWQVFNPSLSPDGKWLAVPLTDGLTTNIWALSIETNQWRRVTDFGDRAIFIARRVAWAPDSKSIYAAIGEGDTDIVSIDGLIRGHATAAAGR